MITRFIELGAAAPAEWKGLDVPTLASVIKTAEADEETSCDRIITEFLEELPIGKPMPLQAYFCATRCMCALDTLGILHAAEGYSPLYPAPPEGWKLQQQLEWLLEDNWVQRRDTWLRLVAFGAATGRGLYGQGSS